MLKKNNFFKSVLIDLGLVLLAALLFAASFPNLLIEHGIPFFAWFAYIPILIVIHKYGLLSCMGWGAIYGFAAYGLFNYWLGAFHPLAGTIVYSIYLVYHIVVFLLLKAADLFYKKRAYLVQWLIWLAYEYLSTQGFLGYSYGVTGYSQWQIIPLIQIASVTGVWGVSALVTFPSFWLSAIFQKDSVKKREDTENKDRKKKDAKETSLHPRSSPPLNEILIRIKSGDKIPAFIWAAALIAALVFGFISMKDFSSYPKAQIALIQQNTDPWEATKASTNYLINQAYRKDLSVLLRLSDEALASSPKPQLVVWPETAFIPRIYWQVNYRDDQNTWLLVRDLLEYLASKDIPFLIGNDDGRMDPSRNPDANEYFRIDYNAAMFYENGVNTQTYRKLHLVPFTEHFPYEKQLPWVHKALKDADTHFWEKGDEYTVFQGPGFKFSSPICFEDTFGYLSRIFVQNGADIIVNISNDAWSNSLPAQNQHLSMAVFRSVENHRSMVRSTASGQTCAVDPNGRVIAEAAPFAETWLNVAVPVAAQTTIYTRYGDYLGVFFLAAALTFLLLGVLWYIIGKRKGAVNEYAEKDINRR